MKINGIAQVNSFVRNTGISTASAEKKYTNNQKNKLNNNIPSSVYKANFMPAFGKYRKIKEVQLTDKRTEEPVTASLVKDSIGDYSMYKIMLNRKEAGFMDVNNDSILPEIGCLSTEPDNNIPEVRHLRSVLGDKYYGIGTELIKAAVEESEKKGKNGALWLTAEKGYASTYSKYRSNENPIPFYYKLGFRALDENLDNEIKKILQTGNYRALPPSAVLILSSQDAYDFKKYYSTHYTHNDRSA